MDTCNSNQMLEEGTLSDSFVTESPKSSSSSSSSAPLDKEQLQMRNKDLRAYSHAQGQKILELENAIECLVLAITEKEEEWQQAVNYKSLASKKLQKIESLEADNWKLAIEVEEMRGVVEDQRERLVAASRGEDNRGNKSPSYVVMNLGQDWSTREKNDQIQALLRKANDLVVLVKQKDNELKAIQQQLHFRDLGLLKFEKVIDETCRRKSDVEVKLNATSIENFHLRYRTSVLKGKVENGTKELKEMQRKLDAEKEAAMLLSIEKDKMVQKYKELIKYDKEAYDKTFMNMYDEHIYTPQTLQEDLASSLNQEFVSEVFVDSERNSDGNWDEYATEGLDDEGNCQFQNYTPGERRKSKPTREPPPVPRGDTDKNDDAELHNHADYEYFLMSSIAVRMNLAEEFKNDYIMQLELGNLWDVCRQNQVPMNMYYFYIEKEIREEFNLPRLNHNGFSTVGQSTNMSCCCVM